MRIEKSKKKIVGIIFALAAAGLLVSFSKMSTEEPIQAESDKVTENEAKSIYTEEYQEAIEEQIEEEKNSGIYTEDQMLVKENLVSVSYTVSVAFWYQ